MFKKFIKKEEETADTDEKKDDERVGEDAGGKELSVEEEWKTEEGKTEPMKQLGKSAGRCHVFHLCLLVYNVAMV